MYSNHIYQDIVVIHCDTWDDNWEDWKNWDEDSDNSDNNDNNDGTVWRDPHCHNQPYPVRPRPQTIWESFQIIPVWYTKEWTTNWGSGTMVDPSVHFSRVFFFLRGSFNIFIYSWGGQDWASLPTHPLALHGHSISKWATMLVVDHIWPLNRTQAANIILNHNHSVDVRLQCKGNSTGILPNIHLRQAYKQFRWISAWPAWPKMTRNAWRLMSEICCWGDQGVGLDADVPAFLLSLNPSPVRSSNFISAPLWIAKGKWSKQHFGKIPSPWVLHVEFVPHSAVWIRLIPWFSSSLRREHAHFLRLNLHLKV